MLASCVVCQTTKHESWISVFYNNLVIKYFLQQQPVVPVAAAVDSVSHFKVLEDPAKTSIEWTPSVCKFALLMFYICRVCQHKWLESLKRVADLSDLIPSVHNYAFLMLILFVFYCWRLTRSKCVWTLETYLLIAALNHNSATKLVWVELPLRGADCHNWSAGLRYQ